LLFHYVNELGEGQPESTPVTFLAQVQSLFGQFNDEFLLVSIFTLGGKTDSAKDFSRAVHKSREVLCYIVV
jgi:hypothetical protein